MNRDTEFWFREFYDEFGMLVARNDCLDLAGFCSMPMDQTLISHYIIKMSKLGLIKVGKDKNPSDAATQCFYSAVLNSICGDIASIICNKDRYEIWFNKGKIAERMECYEYWQGVCMFYDVTDADWGFVVEFPDLDAMNDFIFDRLVHTMENRSHRKNEPSYNSGREYNDFFI